MRYAIVESYTRNGVWKFTKFHTSEEEAIAEATRLCKKESEEFLILKVVKSVCPKETPVEIFEEE